MKPHIKKSSHLVYSTDQGRIKPPIEDEAATSRPASDGIIRLARETKGRSGKGVTLISGFDLDTEALKEMGKTLKQLCGTGGTVKDGVIEIQGDQRDKILAWLTEKGFKAKRSGA